MTTEAERNYLVAFATVPGIGAVRLNLLLEYFGSAEKAWEANEKDLARTGLPTDALRELLEQKRKLNVRQYLQSILDREIKILTIKDKDYPERLKNIPSPPLVLFVKCRDMYVSDNDRYKKQTLFEGRNIGVVGTRKMTSYGQEVTEQLVAGLVASGFTIVSGMALGIDGVAHGAAINAGGKTMAILGAGVDIIYPRAHKDLYNSILEHGGAIVSEVAPGKGVIRGMFPARNRIISGLSEAVLVTEGAIDSGSLITARAALDQGREVFAVPGPINSPMNEGTNYLLKQGAKLVTSVGDILEGLGYASDVSDIGNKNILVGDNEEEQKVIDLLRNESLDFDQLVQKTGIFASKLGAILGIMEVKGKIKNQGLVYRL